MSYKMSMIGLLDFEKVKYKHNRILYKKWKA
jgi:hypothetical protein